MADQKPNSPADDPYLSITIEPARENRAEWMVQFRGAEFGPYSVVEFKAILMNGKLKGDVYLWRPGLENWLPIAAITNFRDSLPAESRVNVRRKHERGIKTGDWKRKEGRYPLIATVEVKGLGGVLGVCADVSMSGFQVLLDKNVKIQGQGPFEITICPLGVSGMTSLTFQAMLGWVKPEQRRAGFTMGKLETNADAKLRAYLGKLEAREAQLGTWDKMQLPD